MTKFGKVPQRFTSEISTVLVYGGAVTDGLLVMDPNVHVLPVFVGWSPYPVAVFDGVVVQFQLASFKLFK